MERPEPRCKAHAALLHWNDAGRSAVAATIKAVRIVPFGSNVTDGEISERARAAFARARRQGLSLQEAEELLATWSCAACRVDQQDFFVS
jgi:DNA-binding IclR family transcriptional regulator